MKFHELSNSENSLELIKNSRNLIKKAWKKCADQKQGIDAED